MHSLTAQEFERQEAASILQNAAGDYARRFMLRAFTRPVVIRRRLAERSIDRANFPGGGKVNCRSGHPSFHGFAVTILDCGGTGGVQSGHSVNVLPPKVHRIARLQLHKAHIV
jgi:hypothetical protein